MQVEFYGVLAEAAGTRRVQLDLAAPGRVQHVLDTLARDLPPLAEHLPRVACAVGDELVMRDDLVEADAILALLPPVSGG